MGLFKDMGKQMVDYYKNPKGPTPQQKLQKMREELGYEHICGGGTGLATAGAIWQKSGNYYFVPIRITGDLSPEEITSTEITGVGEITKNAKLVALEVRYRINGAINSMRIESGIMTGIDANALLTIEDKLGYGAAAAPQSAQSWQDESASDDKPAFCGQCGARNTSSVKFCTSCGAPLQ